MDDVSSQAFEEKTLAGLAERVGMEEALLMRRANLSDRFSSCATRTVVHRVWLVNTLPGSGLETAERLFALPLSDPATAAPAQAPTDDPPVSTCFMIRSHDPCRDHQGKCYASSD